MQSALQDVGLKVELTAPHTQQPKGLQESAGKAIMTRTRALRIAANIPEKLVNELALSAIQLLNTTPIESLNWRTPYEVVHGRKPTVSHYKPIGCRAYALKKGTYALATADKTSSRVHIGYLMGYDSTNIFRIWVPALSRLIRTRDVVFNPKAIWKSDQEDSFKTPNVSEVDIEVLDLTQPVYDVTAEDLYSAEQQNRHLEESEASTASASASPSTPTDTPSKAHNQQLLTPKDSHLSGNSLSDQDSPTPRAESPDTQQLIDQQLLDDQVQQLHAPTAHNAPKVSSTQPRSRDA